MVTTVPQETLATYYLANTAKYVTGVTYYYTEKLYYDSHGPVISACPFIAITGWVAASDTATSCKGLLTGRITKTYYPTNAYFTTSEKTEAYYYDKYGRVRQTVSKNFTGGTEAVTYVYNFANQIVQTRHSHTVGSNTYNLDMYYSYDHRGRLLNTEYEVTKYSCPGVARTIVSANMYNEAGSLKTKYLHSVKSTGLAFMQKVDYTYNVRGWLTGINDPGLSTSGSDGDKFGMKIGYNRQPNGTTAGLYNGNISGIKWGTPNYQNLQYLFTYDGVNRDTSATFSGSGFTSLAYKTSYRYNKNGNFTSASRYGSTGVLTDVISYTYNSYSNQLNSSTDSRGDIAGVDDFSGTLTGINRYGYDGNGNLIRDDYKGLTIKNNYMNLPDTLDFGSNSKINYFYNSTGEKMMRSVMINSGTPTVTSYFGPFVSEGLQGGTISLKYIMTPEGRIINNGTDASPSWSWEYNLTDHLGNVRAVITPATTAGYSTLVQQTHYYPFGMRMSQISTALTSTGNDYLYNGKQYQDDLNLNWYDYGARFYDPALGRWHSVDPLAEVNYSQSPYHFCNNNPIRFVDPSGMSCNPIYDEGTSEFLGTDDLGLQGDAIIMDKDDFEQGMSHEDAMSVGNTLDNMSDEQAMQFANNGNFESFMNHYNSLSSRPDWDGFVTADEGIQWAKDHPGALDNPTSDNMLYLDASKLDFGNISTSGFASEGIKTPKNLLNIPNSVESRFNADLYNTVYALGRVYMVLKSRDEATVGIFNDYNQKSDRATDYDWNAGGGFIRNALIKNERFRNDLKEGDGFRVYYYGIGKLRK